MTFFATEKGVVAYDNNEFFDSLPGKYTNSIVTLGDTIFAGTKAGVYYSKDNGKTWQAANEGLEIPHIRRLYVHPDKKHIFAGTEPALILYSEDDGSTWQPNKEVAQYRDKHDWFLFYSPEAGCVRGFAFNGKVGYAAVEVGGLLKTTDYGRNWQLIKDTTLHADVHEVYVHSSSPKLVYAATGGGLYTSQDGGLSWKHVHHDYCQSAWIDPQEPAHIIFSPAQSSSQSDGRIIESFDAGKTWQNAMQGSGAPWDKGIVTRFIQKDNQLYAIVSNNTILVTALNNIQWKQVYSDVIAVHDLTFLE